jgi:hypothetical protein
MPIPVRGLKNIRTLAGRVDRLAIPCRAHLQIASLEIEKARHAAERATVSRRVAELDARLRGIDSEETTLLQGLAERSKGKGVGSSGPGSKLVPRPSNGALRIRY